MNHKVLIEFTSEDDANKFARQLGKVVAHNGGALNMGLMLSAIQKTGEIISYPAGVIDVQAVQTPK